MQIAFFLGRLTMGIPILHRLSIRVLWGSVVLVLVLFSTYSYFTIRYSGDQMTKQVIVSANRMSDVIKQATHYSMLLNRREDVYQIISMIGGEPGVEGIRIYNKRGEIMYSTDKREEHTTVEMNVEACFVCHERSKPLSSLQISERSRIYNTNGHRILGLINPIRNESSCSNASCHAHPADHTILGVLDVRMSLEEMDKSISRAQNTTMAVAIGLSLLVALIAITSLSSTVIKPVRQLMRGTQLIAAGNYDHSIPNARRDELGTLATTFNEMTLSLQRAKEENNRWAATLQDRIREKTDELNTIHKQILHIEKMASLGKLSATVAHELNNPLEAILTYAKLIARRLRKENTLQSPNLEDIELISREADRCGTIVKNLLLFSKKQVGEFALVPIQQILEKAKGLIHHHCQISNVQLNVQYHDVDITLMGNENQIQQALIALFVNAVEAMPDGGTIRVDVSAPPSSDDVKITIADTGVGISPEDLPHMFEPFFTTKKDGKGTGLGLSIVYGIIERHGGNISITSELQKGTIVTILLPRVGKAQQPVHDSAIRSQPDTSRGVTV
jgi:two-component system NtrC family sensor kinase